MSDYYLGIDGGGTKTRATILDSSGRVVGVGIGESSNIGNIGKEKASDHIRGAVSLAASEAGIAPIPLLLRFSVLQVSFRTMIRILSLRLQKD